MGRYAEANKNGSGKEVKGLVIIKRLIKERFHDEAKKQIMEAIGYIKKCNVYIKTLANYF